MMNNDMPPSLHEWKALYEAAIEFKELAPWDWMHDTDIFGDAMHGLDSGIIYRVFFHGT